MALLNILSSLAALAQGDIAGGIKGFASDSAQGKEDERLKKKQQMASKLLQDPKNATQMESMTPEQKAYLQDAASQGNFNEIQQGFSQHAKNQQLGARKEAVKKIYGQTALSLNAAPEIAQAGMTYLDTDNPEEALQFLSRNASQQRAIQGQQRAERNQARSEDNQATSAAISLANQQEQTANKEAEALGKSIPEFDDKLFSVKQALTSKGLTEADLDPDKTPPALFRRKYGIATVEEAKALQEQLASSQTGMIEGFLGKPKKTPQELIDATLTPLLPKDAEANIKATKASIEQKKLEAKAAADIRNNLQTKKVGVKTAKELGLTPKLNLKKVSDDELLKMLNGQ